MWRDLNKEGQAPYLKKAEADKKRYAAEMESYTPPAAEEGAEEGAEKEEEAEEGGPKKKTKEAAAAKKVSAADLQRRKPATE